jgi:hypothetical protein
MSSSRKHSDSHTLTPYSREDEARIRARAKNPDLALVCPLCVASLCVGPPIQEGQHMIRLLACPICRRCLRIKDMPERRELK